MSLQIMRKIKKQTIPLVAFLVIALTVGRADWVNGEKARQSPAPVDSISPMAAPNSLSVSTYTYTIVKSYPHDRHAFTQGLAIDNGVLYEGTGRFGRSTLRRVELGSGKVVKIRRLPDWYFGEGITVYGDRIIQLTWKSKIGLVYDKESFELIREFRYPTEGWGLTHNGIHLIMSDGTATLHFLDVETFKEIKRVEVFDHNGPVSRLNELEYMQGRVYANVWQTDRIAMIDPETGQVTGWIKLEGLLNSENRGESGGFLNGIAYDAENDRLLVTGKLWPLLFEIELKPLQ